MNKRQFLRQRRPAWKRFERLVERLERLSIRKLPAAEVSEFSTLFRELSNDLAIIRSRAWGQALVSYLNNLVVRGHSSFYSAPPGNAAYAVRFLTTEFPRLFRANFGYFLTAAILFFVPGAISWAVIQNNPSLASRIIPNEVLDQFDAMYASDSEPSAGEAEEGEGTAADEEGDSIWQSGFAEERTAMAGFYVYNNVGIALACFARGVLLGVGTVYTLIFNGIFIGAIGGYILAQGHGERFLSFIISHGSFELTAIAVAGGAGLILGNALIHPGQRTRLESLRVRGLEAIQIAAGAAVMLGIAALIEAFWSPSGVPALWKYIVGTFLWILVFLYLGLAGRGRTNA